MNHSYDTFAHVAYTTARRIKPSDNWAPPSRKPTLRKLPRNARRSWTPARRKPGRCAGFRRTPIEERRCFEHSGSNTRLPARAWTMHVI